jgi:hypothetical protein
VYKLHGGVDLAIAFNAHNDHEAPAEKNEEKHKTPEDWRGTRKPHALRAWCGRHAR